MFCSNCGKSLKPEHTVCPSCGMIVGESRFDSNRGYTGAQNKLRPGQAVRVNNSYGNHYSTSFNVESDKKQSLPSDEDVSYRAAAGASVTGYGENDDREPLFDSETDDSWDLENEASEEIEIAEEKPEKRSFRAMFLKKEEIDEEDEATLDESDGDELTQDELSSIRLNEVSETPAAGISEDVKRFMSGLREEYDRKKSEEEKKAAKKKGKKAADEIKARDLGYDAYDEDDEGKINKKKDKKAKKASEESFDDLDDDDLLVDADEDEPLDDIAEEEEKPKKEKKASRKQIRVAREFFKKSKPEEDFDAFDPDEDEEEEPPEDDEYADDYDDEDIDEELRRENRLKVLRTILAAAAAVLLIVIGVLIFKTVSSGQKNKAPVPDVSYELWVEGTSLMQYRVSEDYIEEKMRIYNASDPNTSWALFSSSFTQDLDGLNSLLPPSDSRQLNDQLFVDALKAIQTNINNSLSNDWIALISTTMTESQKRSESEQRWQVVRNQVTQLINATSKGALEAVKKSEVVSYTVDSNDDEAEAQATPEVTYVSLQRGSSGDEVIKLQTRLTNLGYLNDTIDGKYGNKTVTAVQLFQQTVGLTATGIADEQTQRLLYAADAPMNSR